MQRKHWGRILTLTSITTKQPVTDLVLSNAVRAAVVGLVKSLANEFGKDGILVNNVGPGFTATDRLKELATARSTASGKSEQEIFDEMCIRDSFANALARDRASPVLKACGEKSLGGRSAGIGNADIDAAEFFHDSSHEPTDGSRIGDVEGLGQNFHVMLASDFPGGSLEGGLIASAHGDAAALGSKGFGGGAADSLAGGGNQSNPIFQSEIHESGIIKGSEANARQLPGKNTPHPRARPVPYAVHACAG